MTENKIHGEYIGLTQAEAERALRSSGENRFAKAKKVDPVKIFAGQFHDVMVMILLAAAAVSIFIGGWKDALPIIIIVVMNAALGFFQEYRCEKTLEQMERLTAPTARVYRDGILKTIPASQVVVGDVFEIQAGDRFPCDCLIISQSALTCDESALTGETVPAVKTAYIGSDTAGVVNALNTPYIGYMGTTALKGRARCQAIATGESTQMGGISQMLGDIDDEQTPLQKKLAELGRTLALICLGVCVIVFAAGVIRGENIGQMFFTAVTVAIAAIPEGLPAAVTIALALAVRRMLKQNALVHRLHSVETLGCANVICTDKTGTLTKNHMTVKYLSVLADSLREYENPDDGEKGILLRGSAERRMAWETPALSETLLCAALCNNSKRSGGRPKERCRSHKVTFEGDPTENALMELCAVCGIDADDLLLERVDEKPFDSDV